MKPIKLTIEGINSFTDAQTLDFEAVGRSNLFCICGKTGAGKTTIFDSIMLALYGRSGKGNLADAVNLSRNYGVVTLDFSAGGDRYTVERVIKCKNEKDDDGEPTGKRTATSECTLYKNGEPVAKGEEASATISALIGLGESEFKNVYLLEQGEYADFLKKQPSKQLEAVGKIFALTRFGDVGRYAGEKKREAEAACAALDKTVSEVGDVATETVKEKKSALASLKSKLAASTRDIEAKSAELSALEKERDIYMAVVEKQKAVAEYAAKAEAARERLKSAETARMAFESMPPRVDGEKTAELRLRLNELSALAALDREASAAEAECAQKRELCAAADKKLSESEASCARFKLVAEDRRREFCEDIARFIKTTAEIGDKSETLAVALSALNRQDASATDVASAYYSLSAELVAYNGFESRRKEAEQKEKDAVAAADSAFKTAEMFMTELVSAREDADEKRKAQENATARLDAARLKSQAAAVAAELKEGDICPVCGGVYGGCHVQSGDVNACKAELAAAELARKDADSKVAELEKRTDRAKAEYSRRSEDAQSAAAESKEAMEAEQTSCVEPNVYKTMIDILSSAKKRGEACEKSEKDYSAIVPVYTAAKAESTASHSALEEAENRLREFSQRLGDMRGKTDGAVASLKEEIAAAEKELNEYEEKRRALATERDAAQEAVKTVEELLESARRDCPTDVPEFDGDVYREKREAAEAARNEYARLVAETASAETELKATSERYEKVKNLKAERAGYAKRADIFSAISDMTKGKAMLNFVATEYIEHFTAEASDILGILSDGKFSMRYDRDGGFLVSDYLNEGKTRKTDTLSGGELFLASLSVAIAISREVGDGDNAFFFLDEGFGTLDDELIDTVYGALEELAKTCLVGVITHSSALIDRMPSCVEVIEANDTVGSRIEY